MGVPALLSDWEDFVRSRDALRVAVACKRSGRPFPIVTPDEVVQFCVEEACFERLHLSEQNAGRARAGEAEQQGALGDAVTQARRFASTGVA